MIKEVEGVKSALNWIDKVVDFLKPYKPQTKKIRINHNDQTSEIALLISIAGDYKRKVAKLKVPAYQNFYIHEMQAEDFTSVDIGDCWSFINGHWVLDTKSLPPFDNFFLRLRGHMPSEIISKIVFVEESENRDQTPEIDSYWLKCMIRDVDLVEKVWDALEIEEVGLDIKVGINRCFSVAVPSTYSKKIEKVQRFLRAGHEKDREELFRAWNEYRRAHQMKGISVRGLTMLIEKLTSGEIFGKYVSVDEPYHLGAIRREREFSGNFPEHMSVQANTNLNLKECIADGYLVFEKKKYIDRIKDDINTEE